MKNYRMLPNSENFIMDTGEGQTKLGFYVTCFVEALGPEKAELTAEDLIRKRKDITPLNTEDDQPMLYADEIDEVDDFESFASHKQTGYAWYNEEET